jgi:hypothetical protein
MTDPTNEAHEWLEAHMDKKLAVIETRLVNALLEEIETMRQDKMIPNHQNTVSPSPGMMTDGGH